MLRKDAIFEKRSPFTACPGAPIILVTEGLLPYKLMNAETAVSSRVTN